MKTAVQKELDLIYARGKVLRPTDVVKYATNPKTALHKKFEWDDNKAARAYRIWQARELITEYVVVIAQTSKPVQVYVSLAADRLAKGGGYRCITDVMSNANWRKEFLKQAFNEAELFRQKYEGLKELNLIFKAIKLTISKFS